MTLPTESSFERESPLNNVAVLRDVFDHWYQVFWRQELVGERLDRDLGLIRSLGRLAAPMHILDLACGFGRLANALAKEGHHVTGIDLSDAMLHAARDAAAAQGVEVDYVSTDWRELTYQATYDCALLWFTSFGYLGESDDALVLERARDALKPGGRFLIETRHWDSMQRSFEPTTVRSCASDFLIEHHEYDAEKGVQWTNQTLLVGGRRLERRYGIRRYTFPEMRNMCLRAGFAKVSGFDERGAPLKPNSRRCVLVAIR